jgi:plastocyanin
MGLCAAGAVALVLGTSAVAAADEERTLTIKGHVFSPAEVRVKAHTKTKLIVTNQDAAAEEFESPSLNREKMIRPGQSATILLPPLKPGRYEFFGEFHPETARGAVIAE